jgi:hypothetical protein
MKKAGWTLESIGHIRQRFGLIVAGENEDMDGHGHGHGYGQGRTGGKNMRERLVRLTGEKSKSPARPAIANLHTRCHPIPGPGRDGPDASGMKQFVESSSIQGRLSGISRGLADRVLVWLTEGEVVVDASQAQAQARNGPPTKITVLYIVQDRHADGKGALRISICTGPFPLCPCPDWGSYLRGSITVGCG